MNHSPKALPRPPAARLFRKPRVPPEDVWSVCFPPNWSLGPLFPSPVSVEQPVELLKLLASCSEGGQRCEGTCRKPIVWGLKSDAHRAQRKDRPHSTVGAGGTGGLSPGSGVSGSPLQAVRGRRPGASSVSGGAENQETGFLCKICLFAIVNY